MRELPGIDEERLRACLQDQYDLIPVVLEFLPLGHDYDAGVYRVGSTQGSEYLLKVTSRLLYEPSYLVPAYLRDQGITSIVAPVPTSSGALWTQIGNWRVLLYPWINGESSLTGMTAAQWQEVGSIFRRIHQVRLPTFGFESLRKERFDPTEYAQWIQIFEVQRLPDLSSASASLRALHSSWLEHQPTIHNGLATLEQLAKILQSRTFPYAICHADLHARNLIRAPSGHVFVIDWDEVMLAPKERDFIFLRKPHAEAFFQGYKDTVIDWSLVAYYLWERVVQDVIYDVHNVVVRDDWAEETRAQVVQMFHDSLGPRGGNLRAASEASAYVDSLSSPLPLYPPF
ncbi:spectinomycin phosphotransferase [Reticulibacter mediterranei]|uniref:Spectinomycin phosphotransferase n=1 Tax=Reticulibacter mediterranei TaxID=2778369 RepID=A0A8J3N421_9CHLR|nr:aminoglycoside phosphotransferase family protein [Reticulibacter mediterranei]GHO97717.1 spectinomycin phosphotransferase [Reticulibacter mediterranei]